MIIIKYRIMDNNICIATNVEPCCFSSGLRHNDFIKGKLFNWGTKPDYCSLCGGEYKYIEDRIKNEKKINIKEKNQC